MCHSRSPGNLILDLFGKDYWRQIACTPIKSYWTGMERRGNAAELCGSLSFEILCNRDDYIALFVPTIDIPVSLDNLLQWITSINSGLQLPRLNNLSEES